MFPCHNNDNSTFAVDFENNISDAVNDKHVDANVSDTTFVDDACTFRERNSSGDIIVHECNSRNRNSFHGC